MVRWSLDGDGVDGEAWAPPRRDLPLNRTRILLVVGALAAVGAGAFLAIRGGLGRAPSPPRFPGAHLVLLSVDTLRRDALSIHGGAPTPHVEALARESIVFDEAVAPSNHTGPSHMTMLSGYSPEVHGVVNSRESAPMRPSAKLRTFAERMREARYATYGDTDGGYLSRPFGFARGFERFASEAEGLAPKTDRALDWLGGLPEGTPGFVFLHTYEVHAPYLPGSEALARVVAEHGDTDSAKRLQSAIQNGVTDHDKLAAELFWGLYHGDGTMPDREVAFLRALYRACVERLDERIGALVRGLRERDLLERTILVVTSDHGEQFHEHGGLQHDTVFDEVLRVPLLVRLPGAAEGGSRSSVVFGLVHLLPTLFDLLALEVPQGLEGRTLAPALARRSGGSAGIAYAAHCKGESRFRAVARTHALKVVRAASGAAPAEAYDLAKDPGETASRAIDGWPEAEGLSSALRGMEAVWKAMRETHGPRAEPGAEIDEALRAQLRQLGYVR